MFDDLVSRRRFIARTLKATATAVTSTGLAGGLSSCGGDGGDGDFHHGVASGDPLSDSVILWTRVSPQKSRGKKTPGKGGIWVAWQVARDPQFKHLEVLDATLVTAERDYTLKVDARGLAPGQTYYYRFLTVGAISPVGVTRTLPVGDVSQVSLGVVSCSNFPAGYFHVYRALAETAGLDAIVHLGDYIYEYGRGEYASEDAAALGREVLPETEILTLNDYRTRYAQYRLDPDLQAAHASAAFVCVWDDHEIANDAWREGAENHDPDEGEYSVRLATALRAYAEWMPVRPPVDEDPAALARSFQFGNLVNLSMLDTRIIARAEQLQLTDFFATDGSFDGQAFAAALTDSSRTLLGGAQLAWLEYELTRACVWQVLGQQVLMGKMELPAAIATQQLSIPEFAQLAQLAQIAETAPESLTPQQLQLLQEQGPLLQLGNLPYNLDAWDGYPIDRAAVLAAAAAQQANLVVLAGDTHNAWANQLSYQDQAVGVELATPSVTSPGLEDYLGLESDAAVTQTEAALVQIIDGLRYTNLADRGYMVVKFTAERVDARWHFIDSIKTRECHLLENRSQALSVLAGSNRF